MSETLYMRISTQNIACSQRQMNTCHTSFSYILWAYGEYIMSKWSSRTSDQFLWLVSEKKTERQTDRQRDTDRRTNCDQCLSMVQCCFTPTETVRLIRTDSPGRPPRLSHSSWALPPLGNNWSKRSPILSLAQHHLTALDLFWASFFVRVHGLSVALRPQNT